MKKVFAVTAAFALLGLGIAAQANIAIDTVAVGDPGNIGELSGRESPVWGAGPLGICGSVDYNYNIGKYEVTAGQYTAFLNAVAATDTYGLYNSSMSSAGTGRIIRSGGSGSYTYSVASGYVNRPVNWVSFWDCCRFANWLHNGQPTGPQHASTTERGAYTLDGYNGDDGRTIGRNAGSKWAVTSEDEWYKAAYYKGGGIYAGYWDYPTRSDTDPGRDMADASGNNANYYIGEGAYPIDPAPYYTTVAGEFQNSVSHYGTFDQGGNVMEWNEAVMYDYYRGVRGGSFGPDGSVHALSASWRLDTPPWNENGHIGFRVSGVPGGWVPQLIYGISNCAAYHPIISTAPVKFGFKVWGKVTNLVSGNSFTVDDGSGAPVNIFAPGFSGIQNGDYASAKGKLSGDGSNRVLNAQASDVVKLQ